MWANSNEEKIMAKSSSGSTGGKGGGRPPSSHPGPGGNWPSTNPGRPSGGNRGVGPKGK